MFDESLSELYSPRCSWTGPWIPWDWLLWERIKWHTVVLRDVVQNRTGQDYVAHFFWRVQECPSCMPKTHPPPLQKTRTAFHRSACLYVRLVKPLLLLPVRIGKGGYKIIQQRITFVT